MPINDIYTVKTKNKTATMIFTVLKENPFSKIGSSNRLKIQTQEIRQIVAMPTLSQILLSAPFCKAKQKEVAERISETDNTFLGLKAKVDKIIKTAIIINISITKEKTLFDVMYSAVKYLSLLIAIKSDEIVKNEITNEARIF